jgi:hypothetical protein
MSVAARVAERILARSRVGLVARVASRQLVKDAIQAFAKARPRIEALLDAKNVTEAKERFLELGRDLQPLAAALDNVKLSRPDEQRKLKNVTERLRVLKYPFEDRFLEGDDGESDAWIYQSLDQIGNVLKSLVRMAERIEGYAKVEKTFAHGPWVIINKYGFSVSEYAEPLQVLDAASALIRAKGFGNALYGKVELDTKVSRPGIAGEYYKQSDSITLTVDAQNRQSDVFTLVHELGHRRWHQHLSAAQRDQYEDLYSPGGLTVEQRQDMYQALAQSEFKPGAAKRFLRERDLPVAEYLKEIGASPKDYARAHREGQPWVERQIVRPNHRYVRLKSQKVETVSSYADTNVKEDFAETFATYVFGMPIAESIMQRFRLTL